MKLDKTVVIVRSDLRLSDYYNDIFMNPDMSIYRGKEMEALETGWADFYNDNDEHRHILVLRLKDCPQWSWDLSMVRIKQNKRTSLD